MNSITSQKGLLLSNDNRQRIQSACTTPVMKIAVCQLRCRGDRSDGNRCLGSQQIPFSQLLSATFKWKWTEHHFPMAMTRPSWQDTQQERSSHAIKFILMQSTLLVMMLRNHYHQKKKKKVCLCQKVISSLKVFVSINIPPHGNSQRAATIGTFQISTSCLGLSTPPRWVHLVNYQRKIPHHLGGMMDHNTHPSRQLFPCSTCNYVGKYNVGN